MTITLDQAVNGIADALRPIEAEVPGLQVYPYYNGNPSPPSLDVYPGEPFQEPAGSGVGNKRAWFTVRARVGVADQEAASRLLLRFLDPNDPASVEAALAQDETAVIDNQGSVSGFRRYDDGADGTLLGCEWRIGLWLE